MHETLECNAPVSTPHKIGMSTRDYRDLFISDFVHRRLESGLSTIVYDILVEGNFAGASNFMRKTYGTSTMFCDGTRNIIAILDGFLLECDSSYGGMVEFRIHGTFEKIDEIKAVILREFEEATMHITWIYDTQGNDTRIKLDRTYLPCTEMYPFLDDESLHEYYDRFKKSSASILVLIGPPGTGKTSFIRGFLAHTNSSAIVTYNEAVLNNDGIFASFISGNSATMVIEDADLFLGSRTDGNGMMHKFLNVGDGLVTTKGKKLIFSTNLPNAVNIDAALLRSGRCFDILQFDALNKQQAQDLALAMGIHYNAVDRQTIADILAGKNQSINKKSFGFC